MQTIDGPLSCSECGFLCSTSDDTGTFVDRLSAGRTSPGRNYNRTYHYIRKAYPLWQQLYRQLSLDHSVALRSQCDSNFNDIFLESYRQKAFIDAPRFLGEANNFPENGESEGWLYGQHLRDRTTGSNSGFDAPELPRQVENTAVPYSVLHGAINDISSPRTGASSRGPVTTTTTTHLVFSVTKGNVKAAKKDKLFKSVLWFAVGVKKKKANLKTRRYKVRREIVYHGKLISSVTTFKKLKNRPDNDIKMDNLRSWPTLSGGATTTNFPSPFYQRSFPSPGSGCDWASVVKQRYFESSADKSSSFKRAEETASLQLKASLVVTKTKRVPEKNHVLKSAVKPLLNRTDDKDATTQGSVDSVADRTSPETSSAADATTETAAAEGEGSQSPEDSNPDKSRIFSEANMSLLKTLCSSAPTNATVCEESGDDQLVQSSRDGNVTADPQDAYLGQNTDGSSARSVDDGKLKESPNDTSVVAIEDTKNLEKTPYGDEDESGLNVNIIRVKPSSGGVAGITATVTENSLDIDAEVAARKVLHLTARNILNTKTELSIFSDSKNVTQNFRTHLLKVKSSDEGWRSYGGKNYPDEEKASGLAVSLGHEGDGENVVIICKISNKTQGSESRVDEIPAIEKTEAANNLSESGDVELPPLVDIEAASVDGSGETDERRPTVDGETSQAVLLDDFDLRKRGGEEAAGKLDNDVESAISKSSVQFTSHKTQVKPLRSKMKYDVAATSSFFPVTNWKRKPHASPSLSKYRWIAPPRKDSQLSPRTSSSKFQQNKQASGNQSADYRKISKKLDAATSVGRKTCVGESSAKGNVFAGRGRGSLIKSATFTNSNLDAVDRSYVMSDGMKVVFGPNAVNTPCSKGGGKTKRESVAACKEAKLQNPAEDGADEFRPMKPPSRLGVANVDSYRKVVSQQDQAKNPYQKCNSWKNPTVSRDQQSQPQLYAGQTNCCFGGEPRNGDVMYRVPVDHGLKSKWIPGYDETPDAVQEESKLRYAAPPLFGMLQQGSGYPFCPSVKLCQGNFPGQNGDKLMDVAWRSHPPPWADYPSVDNYASGRFLNKQQQSDNYYGKVDNNQQHPANMQPVFFIPRKETAARNHCGEIQNFCAGNNNLHSYFCRGSHFVGAFGDQEKQ